MVQKAKKTLKSIDRTIILPSIPPLGIIQYTNRSTEIIDIIGIYGFLTDMVAINNDVIDIAIELDFSRDKTHSVPRISTQTIIGTRYTGFNVVNLDITRATTRGAVVLHALHTIKGG